MLVTLCVLTAYTETFSWVDYLKTSRFPAAPKHLFTNTQAAVCIPY